MIKYLPLEEIAEMAECLALRLRLNIPDKELLCAKMKKRNALPQYFADDKTCLWIDKLYIAFYKEDDPEIQYVYLTDSHIDEEYRSYYDARRKRKKEHFLPDSISDIFKNALHQMKESKKNYVIFEIG